MGPLKAIKAMKAWGKTKKAWEEFRTMKLTSTMQWLGQGLLVAVMVLSFWVEFFPPEYREPLRNTIAVMQMALGVAGAKRHPSTGEKLN